MRLCGGCGGPVRLGEECRHCAQALDVKRVFERASAIAKRRFPSGVRSASALGEIVAEAVRLVQSEPVARFPYRHAGHNNLALFMEPLRSEIVRVCTERCKEERPNAAPCVVRDHACYHCQDIAAQAIEAGTAKTEGLGPKDESAVA